MNRTCQKENHDDDSNEGNLLFIHRHGAKLTIFFNKVFAALNFHFRLERLDDKPGHKENGNEIGDVISHFMIPVYAEVRAENIARQRLKQTDEQGRVDPGAYGHTGKAADKHDGGRGLAPGKIKGTGQAVGHGTDDGKGVILRLTEMKGRDTTVDLTFPFEIKEVIRTNLIEEESGSLGISGKTRGIFVKTKVILPS